MRLFKRVLIFSLLLSPLITWNEAFAVTLLSSDKRINPDLISVNGYMYLNVTHAGLQGEKYLLNQQLSTLKLSADFRPTEWSKIHGLIAYNASPTPLYPRIYLDEAFLELKKPSGSHETLIIGKQWLPFGNYKSDLIYKPLTKALGQTNELALLAGYDGRAYASLSFFKPRTPIQSSSLPLYYNFNAGLQGKSENHAYDAGVSYIYSLTDSDLFQYNKGFGGFLNQKINSHVPGIAAYTNFQYKKFNTNLSYVSAVRAFNKNEMTYQESAALPAAMSIQNGYEFEVKAIRCKVIGFYDRSFQALALLLPEERVGAGFNIYPNRYMDVQFQYSKDYSYKKGVTATGLNQRVTGASAIANTLALQLILNF